jgi:nicotinate-nucleotide pyrophosphorylase (carboxylating)
MDSDMINPAYVEAMVALALREDIGTGDVTARLIAEDTQATARVISREAGILCGVDFVNAVFAELDSTLQVVWARRDGDPIEADAELFTVSGNARAILTGERTALNFLQLLSGTATIAHHYAQLVADTSVRLLDTRKTIPGLRLAQKYAVTCGGCHNHRVGLYDAYLIKENHIEASGGIAKAVAAAREKTPDIPVEVEVESLEELRIALDAGADRIMLDNFAVGLLREAVAMAAGAAELEASGNVSEQTIRSIAETGVDFISVGALTKCVTPLDLSMRFDP